MTEEGAPLKVASFFSGIGGFDLGLERGGFEVTMQCEIDPFCNQILEKHWPKVPRFNNIREISNAEIPLSDVWVGGFPCQDVSLARMAQRPGLKGRQSRLFHEFSRLIEEGRPRVFVIENVPGLRSSHGGRDFQAVIQKLAEFGYGVGWRVLNSRYFGVPQSRQRVFIVGCYRDGRGPAEILFESERRSGDDAANGSNGSKALSPFKKSVGNARKGPIVPALAYCLYACSARHTGTDWSRNYVSYPDGRVRRLLAVECERMQGFPIDWTLPLNPPSDPDRLDSLRYKALGNAVTVNVAEWLAERIAKYLLARERPAVEITPSLLQEFSEIADGVAPMLSSGAAQ
jgi:DNA (cytosine-5)-methyltransferase 1